MTNYALKNILDEKVDCYNRLSFIEHDPIQVPHLFKKPEDIEISGFLTATISWGQRVSIINNAKELVEAMKGSPHQFIISADEEDMYEACAGFKHRTFNQEDCHYFFRSLRNIYHHHHGLSGVFYQGYQANHSVRDALSHFRKVFFEIRGMDRTKKHVSDVMKNSAAKRLNMYLRWMVRKDEKKVDFGIWDQIYAKDLYIPLDIHTGAVARKIGLLSRKQNDWKAVEELTANLRRFDLDDPVKYDYALFGMGVYESLIKDPRKP